MNMSACHLINQSNMFLPSNCPTIGTCSNRAGQECQVISTASISSTHAYIHIGGGAGEQGVRCLVVYTVEAGTCIRSSIKLVITLIFLTLTHVCMCYMYCILILHMSSVGTSACGTS